MKRHFFLSTVAGVLLASFLTAPVFVLAVEFYRSSPDATCCAYVTNPIVLGSSSWRQHKRRTNGEKIISTTRDGVSVELRQDDDSLALIVVDSSTGAYVGTLRCQERAVGAVIEALQTYEEKRTKE